MCDVFYGLAVWILRLEHEAIRADGERQFSLPFLCGGVGDFARRNLFADIPCPPIPRALLVPAVSISSRPRRLSHRALRRDEAKRLERSLDRNRSAGERIYRHPYRHALFRRMPIAFRPDARAPLDGPDLERLRRAALLARIVRHMRSHGELERRIARKIGRRRGDRRERHLEDAVLVRLRLAFSDEVLSVVAIVHAEPAPPAGIARLALDVPLHLRVLDGKARICKRLARHRHGLAELRLLGRTLERRRELGTLVLLDVYRLAPFSFSAILKKIPGADSVRSRQAVRRRRKRVREGAPLVGSEFHRSDFLSVRIVQNQPHGHLPLRAEVARERIGMVGDALDLDLLPRTVERTVREKVDELDGLVVLVDVARPLVAERKNLRAVVDNAHMAAKGIRPSLSVDLRHELSVLVRYIRFAKRLEASALLRIPPELHLRAFDRLAGFREIDRSAEIAVSSLHRERERCDGDVLREERLLVRAELVVRGSVEDIVSAWQALRNGAGEFLLGITGLQIEFLRPLFCRNAFQVIVFDRRSCIAVVRLLAHRAVLDEIVETHAHEAKMNLVEIPRLHLDLRPRCAPVALDFDIEVFRLNVGDDVGAHLPAR